MRKRIILYHRTIMMIQLFLCSCLFSINTEVLLFEKDISYKFKINNEIIEIQIDENFDSEKITNKAERLVKDFIEPYSEYIKPEEIIFGKILTTNVYGFQKDNKIYIDNTRGKNEILATAVHELLHIQNPQGLDIEKEFGIIGHNLTEAVVEKITCKLTGIEKTTRVELLESCCTNELYEIIEKSFCTAKPEILNDYLNQGKLHKVSDEKGTYNVSTSDYFRISFDKWMIIPQEEKKIFLKRQ